MGGKLPWDERITVLNLEALNNCRANQKQKSCNMCCAYEISAEIPCHSIMKILIVAESRGSRRGALLIPVLQLSWRKISMRAYSREGSSCGTARTAQSPLSLPGL